MLNEHGLNSYFLDDENCQNIPFEYLNVGQIKLAIPDGVWRPYKTGEQLALKIMPEYESLIKNGVVIDVGTGSGILAVQAGLLGAQQVIALDLNPRALLAVKKSWQINGLEDDRLQALLSDSFSALENQKNIADLIIANPPVQPFLLNNGTPDRAYNEYAWNEAGPNGREVLDEILLKGPSFLKPEGRIITSTSSRHGHQQTIATLEEMKQNKQISNWKTIVEEIHPLAEFYTQYIPLWLELERKDGDPRIFQNADGTYYHKFMVLEIVK